MQQITSLVQDDLNQVKKLIAAQLTSDIPLINQIGHYIIDSGGKHIRPIITLLCAKALGYKGDKHITIAAFIEFIHTATLLHDDVIDESTVRRGNQTANVQFGNAASVLIGDYIYTRAFQMMVTVGSLPILAAMSNVTNVIVEGEVKQLINSQDTELTKEMYFDVIYSKTAKLFEASSHLPAMLMTDDKAILDALKNFGKFLGTAFQIIDDLLDYSSDDAASLGKNPGDDLTEGKLTLPLIHLFDVMKDKALVKDIKNAIINGTSGELFLTVTTLMRDHGSFEFTLKAAKNEAKKAIDSLAVLPNSDYKSALMQLALIAVNRTF